MVKKKKYDIIIGAKKFATPIVIAMCIGLASHYGILPLDMEIIHTVQAGTGIGLIEFIRNGLKNGR